MWESTSRRFLQAIVGKPAPTISGLVFVQPLRRSDRATSRDADAPVAPLMQLRHLALPSRVRVQPPGTTSTDLRTPDDDAELFELLDRPMDGRLVHPELVRDFDLGHLDDILEIETRVQIEEHSQNLRPDVATCRELLEEILVDLHPTVTIRAIDFWTNEDGDNSLVEITLIVKIPDYLGTLHLTLPR